MVDPNSPAFNYAEKIGFFIGKGLRYIIVGGIIVFLGGKFGGSTPSQPSPNPAPAVQPLPGPPGP